MKKIIIMILCVLVVLSMSVESADSRNNDKQLTKDYCLKYYPQHKVKFVKEGKVPKIRKGKKCVYVEVMKTRAKGNGSKWARGKTGLVKLNKRVKKKGKRLKVYIVYNPYTNQYDDIVAVIVQNKIR